jgi:hypothetical protein
VLELAAKIHPVPLQNFMDAQARTPAAPGAAPRCPLRAARRSAAVRLSCREIEASLLALCAAWLRAARAGGSA